jgi:integrase
MHALRHLYASVLLDVGEPIMTLAQYLGHSDPGFTLRVYTHLMPTSHAHPEANDTFLAMGDRTVRAA